ncbi:MogA/MoaB family molybdenum cofactor biosynthesis protein [Atopobiaceae bacterium Sow4_H2]
MTFDRHDHGASERHFSAAVVTVSDRAAAGLRDDESGPALSALLSCKGYEVIGVGVVPDDADAIESELVRLAERDVALVLTTGGTGFSPRDVTPEATCRVCERMAPGIAEAMRAASMAVTDRACLSRGVAGIRGRTLVVNLPGSPKAAVENVSAVLGTLPHGLAVLRGQVSDCAGA